MSYWGQAPPPAPPYAGTPQWSPPPAGYGGAAINLGPVPPYYGQPPASMYPAYPAAQPMPQAGPSYHAIATDPNVFRSHYRAGLVALTFNSKAIINDLTDLAAQHVGRMGAVVAKTIDEHLQQVRACASVPSVRARLRVRARWTEQDRPS